MKKNFRRLVYTVIITAIMMVFSTVAIADVTGLKDANANYNNDGVQNADRAYTQNDQYAILNNDDDNVTYGFGSSIVPAGAVIEGIEVRVDAFINNTSIRTYDLQLYTGTTARGSAINSGTLATTDTDTYKVFGSSTSDWGYGSWTAANVNTLRVKVTTTDGTNNIYLDHIQVRVYYSMTTYDITYNLDGGTNNISNPATYNQATPTINLADPTKAGYTFDGWYSDAGFTTEVTSILMGSTGDVELYAKWIIDTYDITYNLGGGTNNASNPATYQVTTPTINFADPLRAGYTFDGWYSDAGFGVEITSIPIGSTGDVELYAKWVLNTYDITYNLGGGTNNVGNPAGYSVTTPTINFADPTRTGYTFDGWYSDAGFGVAISSIPMGSTGDVEVYAKWVINTYDITYNLGGGTNSVSNPATYQVTTPTINFADPMRAGYTFDGWYKDVGFVVEVNSIPMGSTGDVEVYAKWVINTYDITYNLGGGANNASNPATYKITTPTINFAAPTRTGYTFGGWYSDAGLTAGITSIPMGSTGDVELYAKWIVKVFNINYDVGGGVNSNENPWTYDVDGDDIVLRPPQRPGYVFGGWYDNPELTGNAITRIPADSASDYTLYAKWIAIPVVSNLPQTGQYAILLGALSAIGIGGTGLVVSRKKN